MAGGQFLYDAFKSLEENKGRPLTEEEKTKAYNELLPIAQNTALWEAGPEAIGNAVQLGALKYAFGFGKKAATNVAGQAIKKANDTLLKKVGAVAGGQAIELAGETVTQTQQGPDQAKMEQYVQTGSTAGAPNEYQGLAGAVKAFKEVAPTTLALGAITAGAGGVVKVAGMGGKEVGKVLFTQPKTPEQIAEDQINDASNRVANDLSISPDNTEANNLNQRIKALSQVQEIRKQTLAAIEPTSREAQTLKLDIAEGESMLGEINKQFTGLTGLSETITEAERQQAALAKAITTPEAKPRPLPTDVLPTETPGATYGREEQVYDVFGSITRKPVAIPVEQVVTPPVEVAPTIAEAAPVEPPTPAPVTEQAAPEPTEIETDPVRIQEIKNSIQEGNLILRTGKFNGKKLSPEKLASVQRSVTSSLAKLGETPAVTKAPAPEIAPVKKQSPIESFKGNIKNSGFKYITYSDFRKAKKTEDWENEGGVTIDESYYPTAVVGDTSVAFTTNGLSLYKGRVEVSYEADVDASGNNIFTIERIVTPEGKRGMGSASKALSEVTSSADKAGLTLQLEPAAVKPLIKKGGKGLTSKQLVDWYKRNGFVQKFEGSDLILIRQPASATPAVSETITKPKLGEKGGVLIPTKEDVRYNPLGYDIADVVEDIKQGKTDTPLKAVNQVIKESTDLRKRVAAESTRRQQPRKMGKAAILERIARERSAGNINENTAKALTDFINRVNDDAIWDTAISIRAKGVSNYDFADNLVTFFLNQDKGDFGASVGIHEFWHGLSRFLPDAEVEKINNDYTKELADYLKKNPWFLAFVGRYSLTPEQFEAYKFFNPKEAETKLTPVKDEQGNIVRYKIKFDKDNYRYIMLDEFIAEKMTDLVLGKQQEPNTFLGKLAKVLREFMALIKARLGVNPYEKFYQAVTSTDGKLVLQRETGVAPAMQIYDPVEYDYSTRRMGADLKSITPRTSEETAAFEKASSNKVMARNPELAVAAVRLNNGEITAGEYADLIDELNPFTIKGAESIPTKSKIDQYIDESKKDKVNAPIESGKEVEFRIDIPTYNRSTAAGDTVYAVTAHEPVPETSKRVGTPISYVGVAKVINPKMMTRSISGKGEAIDIATGAGKFPLATVKGNYEPITELPADINDPNVWTEVSYNPIRSSYFVDVRSKNAVVAGDEAIMVGSRVFVKNPQMETRPRGLIGPEKRYMAAEPEQGNAPIKPEAKTVTEGLVQGIDIGKENNMPINNKIESHIKNFAFVRGIFESASDRLRRAKFTKLATAIDDYYDQAQRRLGFANKILLPAFEEYSKQSKATKAKIDEEVKMFFAAQENKRDTDEFFDELNPITQKIVTAWQKFGEESGKENQRIGIKVYDKGLQRWRPIGRIEKFWPRVLKPEYKRALMEPDKYQKEYNEIVEALMKSGRIETPEEAEVFISEYEGKGGQNDYFSGIEAARGQAFPEELYDYSTQVMTDYVARWAQHSSRIEQFGQKLGENSKTLWDRSRESTRDRRTIDYITAAQERVEGYYPNDPIVKGMATLNIWASGLQLGNPASSMLNFFGGTTLNAMVGQPGAFSSYLLSFVELRKLGKELKDAREKGIVSRDLMNIVGDHQVVLESNGLAKAGQKTADFLLKWSGFTPIEQMVRTQSMIIGKSFLKKTLSSLSKNPNSSFSKRSLAWLNRNSIDADKLIVEQGTGPETDKLLRYFANISQGSYTIAQTPIFTDTPIGRFLFKYQKFSTQVMRQSWKNTFEPAWKAVTNKNETLQLPDPTRQLLYRLRLAEAKELGDNRKITLDEIPKKVTKAEGKALTIIPVMMWLGSAYVGGEVILRLRDMLFGVLMKGPSYEDIIRAFEDDEDDDELYLSLERAWYNLIGMGALGLIGNYAQFFMDWQDRERVKNPLDPPALSIFKETATFITNAVDQGKITAGDINNYLNRTFSAYRVSQRLYQTAASGLGFSKAPTVAEEMFRRETASLNKYARRWAASAGLEYRTRRPMDIAPSKMTSINREISSYLQRGEPGAAVAYAKEYLNSLPKSERANAIQSMESGARFRQPLRLGNGPMDQAEKIAFKKWLKEKVSKEDFDKFQKLDSGYQKTYNLFLNGLPNK